MKTKINKKSKYFLSILTGVSFGLGVIGTFAMASEYHYQLTSVLKPVQRVTASAEQSVRDYVLDEVSKAGIDPYEAYAIINCESRWNTQAYNINVGKNGHKSLDMGLWMLNGQYQKVTPECAFDHVCSTSYAIELIKKQGFKPWVCAGILGIK